MKPAMIIEICTRVSHTGAASINDGRVYFPASRLRSRQLIGCRVALSRQTFV